jgi:Pyruvate/2-oxoacid:ferredoxin oxidoreductase gamma subunit
MVVNVEREILLTGVGGQGIQLAAQVLARAGVADGREVMLLGTYGGTMRGGSTDSCLVIADEPIRTPPIVSRVWAVPGVRVLGVEATRVANQVASSMAASLVLVAGFAGATGLVTLGSLLSALEECVPSYRRQHIEANQRALHSGFELLTGQAEPAWPDEANAA